MKNLKQFREDSGYAAKIKAKKEIKYIFERQFY